MCVYKILEYTARVYYIIFHYIRAYDERRVTYTYYIWNSRGSQTVDRQKEKNNYLARA